MELDEYYVGPVYEVEATVTVRVLGPDSTRAKRYVEDALNDSRFVTVDEMDGSAKQIDERTIE